MKSTCWKMKFKGHSSIYLYKIHVNAKSSSFADIQAYQHVSNVLQLFLAQFFDLNKQLSFKFTAFYSFVHTPSYLGEFLKTKVSITEFSVLVLFFSSSIQVYDVILACTTKQK